MGCPRCFAAVTHCAAKLICPRRIVATNAVALRNKAVCKGSPVGSCLNRHVLARLLPSLSHKVVGSPASASRECLNYFEWNTSPNENCLLGKVYTLLSPSALTVKLNRPSIAISLAYRRRTFSSNGPYWTDAECCGDVQYLL
jgi:hypothetical protein